MMIRNNALSSMYHTKADNIDGKYIALCVNPGYIYVSSDFGNTFSQKDSSRAWRGIAVSSTGQYMAAVEYNGYIYISSNYGDTWTAVESLGTGQWTNIAMSGTGAYLLAGTDNANAYKSSNYGSSWNWVSGLSYFDGNVTSVSISHTGQYQLMTGSPESVYYSTNYGSTWTNTAWKSWLFTFCAVSGTGQYALAGASDGYTYRNASYLSGAYDSIAAQVSTLNASVAISGDGKYMTVPRLYSDVRVSSNYGVNFTAVTFTAGGAKNISMSYSGKIQMICVSGGDLYKSVDYGASWSTITNTRAWSGISVNRAP